MKGSILVSIVLLLIVSLQLVSAFGVADSTVDRVRKTLVEKQEQLKKVQDGIQYQEVLLSGSKNYGNKESPIMISYNQEKEQQISELKQLEKTINFEVDFLKKNWEERVVIALYRNLLNRAPEPTGLAHWASVLRVNDVRKTIKAIAHSEEYKQKNMNTPTETVKNGYRIILGREVESDSVLAEQVKNVEKFGPLAVIVALIDSDEYTKAFGDYSVPIPAQITKK
ncbi:predicted protein [Naegleria gruberi]|uniref:Predicted protein n=1 Tax=Naegleria gruberi TaxID=5762 RepID=D2VPI8_NAEGR|nr:uncharacterized protein NAEGRDRAFT_51237 [Naegleria gruberi]EFC41129.1 predicted protein [Naegleria gruberi]|eukprot:XP_002673873.1 predicted protein [Naegleria gruberi strain NEG-M]